MKAIWRGLNPKIENKINKTVKMRPWLFQRLSRNHSSDRIVYKLFNNQVLLQGKYFYKKNGIDIFYEPPT